MRQHAHCGYCGHAFPAAQSWPRRCAACDNTSFLNPLPVAVCLLPVGCGLLCVRRAIPPGLGELALPGGFIERHESWQQAAVRELWEETGIRIEVGEVEHFRTVSSPQGDGVLLIFGRIRQRAALASLPDFSPTSEASEITVIHEPQPLAFSLHTEVVRDYFSPGSTEFAG